MIHTKIPDDIKIGDVFRKNRGASPFVVYIGKVDESNIHKFLDLKLPSAIAPGFYINDFSIESIKSFYHFFIVFGNHYREGEFFSLLTNDDLESNSRDYENLSLETCVTDEADEKIVKIVEEMKRPEEKKSFVFHKLSNDHLAIRCVQGNKFVKYAKETDNRWWTSELAEMSEKWQPINIDYTAYLTLTGLKETTKEQDLKEIEKKIVNTFGCQTDILTPILNDFVSVMTKVHDLKNYKLEVVSVLQHGLSAMANTISNKMNEPDRFRIAKDLVLKYVERIQEK